MTVICEPCSEKRANRDCITNDDKSVCGTCLTYYTSKNGKKRSVKLNACDIYSIVIDNNNTNYYSFVEWGKAKEMGKILVIVYENDANVSPNVQYNKAINHMIKESLKSFKNLSKGMKNTIIKNHPEFRNCLTSYSQYKKYLNEE